jgi:hypothetical protein
MITSKDCIASGVEELEAINRQEGRDALAGDRIVYPVIFKNKSKELWNIWFPHKYEKVVPGGVLYRDIVGDAYNIYSRFAVIEFHGKNKPLKFSIRKGWKEPKRQWPIVEFLNVHGCQFEMAGFRSTRVKMPLGIPILAAVDPNWHVAKFKKYTIKLTDEMKPAWVERIDIDETEIVNRTISPHDGYLDHVQVAKAIKERKEIHHPAVPIETVQVVLEDPLNKKELERLEEAREIYAKEAMSAGAVKERF